MLRRAALLLSVAIGLALGVPAALGQWPLAPPADPLAAKAYAVLERHCARCHQQGRLQRPAPAAGFGHVLQLGRLTRDQQLVIAGNPDASRLWTHMMRKLMPYDVYQEPGGGRTGPDADEILAVRDWIEQAPPLRLRRGLGYARARARKHAGATAPEPVVAIAADKNVYAKGDAVTLRVSSTADCRLTLVAVDVRGRGTVIFPNELAASNELIADQELIVPAPDAGYLFRVTEPGLERVVALCNLGAGAADGIRHDFERQRFTDLGDYRTFLAKAIAGDGTEKPVPHPPRPRRRAISAPPEPWAAPRDVLRTGVVFEVR